jgi:hypothetical protein
MCAHEVSGCAHDFHGGDNDLLYIRTGILNYASSSSNGSQAVLREVIELTECYRLSSTTDRGNSCLGSPAMPPMGRMLCRYGAHTAVEWACYHVCLRAKSPLVCHNSSEQIDLNFFSKEIELT